MDIQAYKMKQKKLHVHWPKYFALGLFLILFIIIKVGRNIGDTLCLILFIIIKLHNLASTMKALPVQNHKESSIKTSF